MRICRGAHLKYQEMRKVVTKQSQISELGSPKILGDSIAHPEKIRLNFILKVLKRLVRMTQEP